MTIDPFSGLANKNCTNDIVVMMSKSAQFPDENNFIDNNTNYRPLYILKI